METENNQPCFIFPFEPYPIQKLFMKELYCTIETNKSGIFESPTGTGKSLSICCSALQWLKDYNNKIISQLESDINKLKEEVSINSDNDDWLQAEYNKIQKNQTLASLRLKLENIKKQNEKYYEMRLRVAKQKSNLGMKCKEYYLYDKKTNTEQNYDVDDTKENSTTAEDLDLVLEEFDDKKHESDNDEIEEQEQNSTKLFISSRTHSQLSQFVGEIKRTIFKDESRVVTLASRQHYCINSDVTRLKNVNLINERCLDLQNSKSKSTSVGEDGKVLKKTKTKACSSCPYYNQTNINRLKERILSEIMDMEDLVKCSKEMKACPYYATRAASDDAEVVLVSHAGIVNAGARSGMSLRLKDSVLILDEAHGLGAALEAAHCAPLPARCLAAVSVYLKLYLARYNARLSSRNLLALNQLLFIVGKLSGMLLKSEEKGKILEETSILTLEDFVIKADIDHLNLRNTIDFCKTTRLAPKLHGFFMRYTPQMLEEEAQKTVVKNNSFENFLKNINKKNLEPQAVNKDQDNKLEQKKNVEVRTETSPGTGLYAVLEFLQMLCDRSECGRVLVKRARDEQSLLKYLLLNPAEHFVDVVKQCRSVIVAGGTMEPISEFTTLLTGDAKQTEGINIVKCDHVVPAENVVAVCVSKGPTNVNLSFTYEHRLSVDLLNEVGRILRNVCNIVPGGVVCFLPSYSYEQSLFEHLNRNGTIDSINKKKAIFREPRSAADVDQVLNKYAKAVRSKDSNTNGALLLSVVGGKLSEGLNFSDDLGRCVIVVGMPYPNVKSPELQEKMSYLNRTIGPGAGNAYYESLCMKAVNQCIGRAVRHVNDYACVLLLDERYSRPQTMNALPSFVQKSLVANCTFGKTIGNLGKFFNAHKEKHS